MTPTLEKAIRSLLADIEDYRFGNGRQQRYWFGPFSEHTTDYGAGGSASVEWPNLAISADVVRQLLPSPKKKRRA